MSAELQESMLPALREDFKRMEALEPAHGPLCQRCLKEAWVYGLLAGPRPLRASDVGR